MDVESIGAASVNGDCHPESPAGKTHDQDMLNESTVAVNGETEKDSDCGAESTETLSQPLKSDFSSEAKVEAASSEQQTVSGVTEKGEAAVSAMAADVEEECEKAEVEADPKDEWLDILGSGQLKKKVETPGKQGSRPKQGELVKLKVKGCLENGDCVYDATETFVVGDGDMITAIEMSVVFMDEGEVATVTTASRFAYGKTGRKPDIPADASLTLTLELLEVKPAPEVSKLTAEERLVFGEQKRERGNELFSQEEYHSSINSYTLALKYLEATSGGLTGSTSVLQNIVDSKLKCFNNMAAAQLKIGANDAAINSCKEVLKSQPENVKALYRQAKGHSGKGEVEKAIQLLKKAIKLDPESKLLHRELASLTQKLKRETESEKTMYKKMMGSLADAASQEKKDSSSSSMLKQMLVTGGVIAAALSVCAAYYRATH